MKITIYLLKLTLLVMLIGFLQAMAYAQKDKVFPAEKGDFTGTWILNEKLSRFSRLAPEKFKYYVIVISFDGGEFHVDRSYQREGQEKSVYNYTLFTDGRGETNVAPTVGTGPKEKMKSKTIWKNNTVTRKFTYKQDFGYLDITEQYRLWKDKDILIFEAVYNSSVNIGQDHRTLVFDRKDVK